MSSGRERQLRVVVFNDVVGSSEQIFADELIAVQHIKNDLALIKDTLQRHGGYLVKSLGDGLLSTFDAPTQALEFVQDAISQLSGRGGRSLKHRFGLHVGEIYADGDDIIGQGVHLASRLQTIAPPNGVAFVQSTYEMVDPDFRRRARPLGPVTLAGLPTPMVCWSIAENQLVDGASLPATSSDGIQDLLSGTRYRLERALGRSHSSRTFLVRDHERDSPALLKIFEGEGNVLEAMAIEAATLDRLRHPRIPRVLEGFIRGDHYCLLQEWIAGPSLEGSFDYLRKKQRLSELLRRVLEVLDVTHRSGILHGDLRPTNLIPAAESGQLFVVDFSLIKSRALGTNFMAASHEPPPAEVSDPAAAGEDFRSFFSPPELARFGRVWPGVDLYALGVTTLVLYTGKTPGQLYDQAQGGWDLAELDAEVRAWLAPLLEESPGRRLQSAADALQLLDRPHLAAGGVSPSLPSAALVDKAQLLAALTRVYGPVVQLLLESSPTAIPAGQVAALRSRLLEAGLGADDVEAALEAATRRPAPPAAAVAEAATSAEVDALRRCLRLAVGPVADILLTPSLIDALLEDETSARQALEGQTLPAEACEALLEEARRLRQQGLEAEEASPDPASASASAAALASAPAVAAAAPPPPPLDARLRQALTEAVGPIGDQILAEVARLPLEQRLAACLEALRHYGVDPALVEQVRRSCGANPGQARR